jgi:hypothetical protein
VERERTHLEQLTRDRAARETAADERSIGLTADILARAAIVRLGGE